MRLFVARLSALVLILCVLLDAAPRAVGAGSLTIIVLDARTAQPVAFAVVFARGPRYLEAVSDNRGEAAFGNLPAGTYRVVVTRYGYDNASISDISVAAGQDRTFSVRLSVKHIKVIASVSTRSKATASSSTLKSESVQATLSGSVVGALESLPGVVVGNGGAISLFGHPASETSLGINGVPVALGASANVDAVDADLFASASIDGGAAAGSSAGMVNFEPPGPTLSWIETLRGIAESYGGSDLSFTEQGSAGRLGVSFAHAARTIGDMLDGKRYFDSSGQAYFHDANDAISGDALTLRYPLSTRNVLFGTAVSIGSFAPFVCRVQTGQVPCGYGPRDAVQSRLNSAQLRDTLFWGADNATLTLFRNGSASYLDQSGYYVNGILTPSSSDERIATNGATVHANLSVSRKRSFVIDMTSVNQSATSVGSAFGTILPAAALPRLHFATGSISSALLSDARFSSTATVGFQSAVGTSAFNTDVALDYRASDSGGISGSYRTGDIAIPTQAYDAVGAPSTLTFDCARNIALGYGPTETSAKTESSMASLNWHHSGKRVDTSLTLTHQVERNAPTLGIVRADALAPNLFPANYLDQANTLAAAACGTPAPIGLTDLYYDVTGIASRALYDNLQFASLVRISPNITAEPSYALTSARAFGTSTLLFNTRSTVVAGRQLPNVPTSTAGLAVAANLGGNATQILLNLHYVSGNNPNDLPPYTVLDFGVLAPLARGTLALTITNVTDSHPGPFATTTDAVSLPMQVGTYPTVAQPLRPISWHVGYRFHIGPPEYGTTFALPEMQPLPDLRGIGGMTFPIGQGPSDPFALNTQDQGCGPEDVAGAKHFLQRLRDYVSDIERQRASGTVDDIAAASDGAVDLVYQAMGSSYVVLVTPTPGGDEHAYADELRPAFSCAWVHMTTGLRDSRNRGLYIESASDRIQPVYIAYQPGIGIFVPESTVKSKPIPQPENSLAFPPVIPVPTTPPTDAFALSTGKACSTEMRSAASFILATLQQYAHAFYDLHQKPQVPDGFAIVVHSTKNGPWLEIRTADLYSLQEVRQCLKVHMIIAKSLREAGWDGAKPPELNYAPQLGLYQPL